jgi:hypothetical protein
MKTGVIVLACLLILAGGVGAVRYRQHLQREEQQRQEQVRRDALNDKRLKELTVKKFDVGLNVFTSVA